MSEIAGGPMVLSVAVRSSKLLPSRLWSKRFLPTPVRKRSMLPVGVEIGGGDAQAGLVQRQAECGRGILEAAVSLVHQQGVAQTLGADDRRGQVEIELAVAVDVEGGRRRTEASADPGDDTRGRP